jgi:hypothetical protein
MSDTTDFFQKPEGYSNFLDIFKETDNTIYNIINSQEPQIIFFYGVLLVIFIFFSSKINFNYSVLIGLIFYSILIFYIYTNLKVNYINNFDKLTEKYDMINTSDNVLKKYPNIIDFLFFMSEFKKTSPPIYYDIQNSFEKFILLYEACLQDIKLINANYITLTTIKNKILYTINSLNFNLLANSGTVKLFQMRKIIERMLNNFLEELRIIQEKDIYYNGFNIKTQPIDTSNVLPVNFLDSHNQYVRNTKQFDILNLYLL